MLARSCLIATAATKQLQRPGTVVRSFGTTQIKMADFKQNAHKLCAVPGPIECEDSVLLANASASVSHVSPGFVKTMGETLSMLKEVLFTKTGQPFLVAGSGTLGWDMVASNLVEPGEEALVLHSGYFADSFADCLEVYGAKVRQIKAPVGAPVPASELAKALEEAKSQGKTYKVVTITHCDTSTGVLADAKGLCETVKRISPSTLTILDAVCSVGSEEIRMDDWGVDVVVSASQKGLSAPPGLSITCASEKALKVLETRKTPVTSYFASWNRWLPIMKAYQSGSPAYFATPPTNLVTALHKSLDMILHSSPSLAERFEAHKAASKRIKDTVQSLGLKQLPVEPACAANGMTAVWAPEGFKPTDIVPKMVERDVVVAAGLHKEVKEKYFRIGHMGPTAVNGSRGDIDHIIKALKESLTEAGYKAPQ